MKKILIRLLNDTFDEPKICTTSSGRFAIYTFDYSSISDLEKTN